MHNIDPTSPSDVAEPTRHTSVRFLRGFPFDRAAPFVLALILAVECLFLMAQARRKPFWYDEILAYDVSSLRPLSRLWSALQAGVDVTPPAFYGFLLLARTIPGDPHVILRLAPIFGYLLALTGVYLFARKRFSPAAGLVATLLLALSPFRPFAIEARPYAIVVGLLAISAVLWQRIEERWWIAPLFAVSLTLAVSSHYLAAIVLSCFGLAELTFVFFSRRIRWRVWIPVALAAVPFLVSLSTLARYQQLFGKHFWARPTWSMVYWALGAILKIPDTLALVLVLLLLLTGATLVWNNSQGGTREGDGFSPAEAVLVMGFLIYPVMLIVLTKLQGSGYTFRYGWPAILGVVLGMLFLFRPDRDGSAAARFFAALLIVFMIQERGIYLNEVKSSSAVFDQWSDLTEQSRKIPDVPVVISGVDYLQIDRYCSADLRGRLYFIGDPEMAARETGKNTIEITNVLLSHYVPLNVEPAGTFLASHRRFLVHSDWAENTWFPRYLLKHNYHLTLLSTGDKSSIFLAD